MLADPSCSHYWVDTRPGRRCNTPSSGWFHGLGTILTTRCIMSTSPGRSRLWLGSLRGSWCGGIGPPYSSCMAGVATDLRKMFQDRYFIKQDTIISDGSRWTWTRRRFWWGFQSAKRISSHTFGLDIVRRWFGSLLWIHQLTDVTNLVTWLFQIEKEIGQSLYLFIFLTLYLLFAAAHSLNWVAVDSYTDGRLGNVQYCFSIEGYVHLALLLKSI